MSGGGPLGVRSARPAPGEQMLSQEFVERHKRRRFVVAIAELAHEFGIGEVTATGVCSLAHSARSTYYELFGPPRRPVAMRLAKPTSGSLTRSSKLRRRPRGGWRR